MHIADDLFPLVVPFTRIAPLPETRIVIDEASLPPTTIMLITAGSSTATHPPLPTSGVAYSSATSPLLGDDSWSQFESSDHDAHTELFHRGAAHAVPSHKCVLSGLGSGVGAGTGKLDGLGDGRIDGAGDGFIVGLVVGVGVGRIDGDAEGNPVGALVGE